MDKRDGEDSAKRLSQKDMQEMLIENFVGLQKAMTNLSIKFESLSEQLRRLLEVFELSAKNFVSNAPESEDKEEVLEKINILLEQNKAIARGVVLLEEKIHVKMDQSQNPQQFANQSRSSQQNRISEEYEESSIDLPKPKPLPKI
jgi:hypothetical protein